MSRIRYILELIVRRLTQVSIILAGTSLAALILLVTAQVIMRRFLSAPIRFAEEFSAFLLVASTAFGINYAMARGEHIQVAFLIDRVPTSVLRWLRVTWCLLGLAFTALLVAVSVDLVLDSLRTQTFAIVSGIPIAPVQALIPLGFAILFLQFLQQIINSLLGPPT